MEIIFYFKDQITFFTSMLGYILRLKISLFFTSLFLSSAATFCKKQERFDRPSVASCLFRKHTHTCLIWRCPNWNGD